MCALATERIVFAEELWTSIFKVMLILMNLFWLMFMSIGQILRTNDTLTPPTKV